MKGVAPLIRDVSFGALPADKAFDANWLLEELDERGATAVIPPRSNRKHERPYDAHAYKWRHLVENYLAKIKEFRGIATRYDKTDCSHAANWNPVAARTDPHFDRTSEPNQGGLGTGLKPCSCPILRSSPMVAVAGAGRRQRSFGLSKRRWA